MSLKIVSRSEGAASFREAFCSLGGGSPALWSRFLDLATPGYAEFWVAVDGDRCVGRVGANRMTSYPGTGAIGFFEASNGDVSKALLDTAESWLGACGMTRVVGPMALNTWFPYRFRVDEHELSFAWEPSHPKEYPSYFAAAGYEPLEHYHTPAAEGLTDYVEKTRPAYETAIAEGFTFRPFDGAKLLDREVPILYRVGQVGFRDNFLYEPIPFEHFRELYVPLANKLDFSYSYFASAPGGDECAFFFIFPDQDYLIFKTITVTPEFRGRGLSTALSHLGAKRGVEKGLARFATALIRDGNHSESYTRKGASLWRHRYVLFAKGLA